MTKVTLEGGIIVRVTGNTFYFTPENTLLITEDRERNGKTAEGQLLLSKQLQPAVVCR